MQYAFVKGTPQLHEAHDQAHYHGPGCKAHGCTVHLHFLRLLAASVVSTLQLRGLRIHSGMRLGSIGTRFLCTTLDALFPGVIHRWGTHREPSTLAQVK